MGLLLALSAAAHARCADGKNVSWYDDQELASGVPVDPKVRFCAHRTLPFGTRLKLTVLETGRVSTCVVLDRGPAKWTGCEVDASQKVAEELGILDLGVAAASIEVIQRREAEAR